MTALVLGVLLASLVGSVHCAGMCGPLVAIYAGMPGAKSGGRGRAAAHAAYSSGRLVVYAAIGAAAGSIGAAIDRVGTLAGFARGAAVVSGLLIIGSGVSTLVSVGGVGARHAVPPFARRLFGGVLQAAARRSALVRAAILGAGTALLPCGWLYTFAATAGGTGRPLAGAVVMAAFWAGTVPALVAFGEALRVVAGPLRRHVPAVCAVVLIVLGLATVFGRSRVASVPGGAAPACHATR